MMREVSTARLPAPRAFVPAGPVPAPPPGHTWETLMDLALAEARGANAQGDVPVGAVIVARDGTLLARGGNAVERHHDPTAHAEMLVLREAGARLGNWRLEGCVLVVTLEPCAMCAAAIARARLAGVVYGAADAAAGAICSRAEYLDGPLAAKPVWHMGGVCSGACRDLLLRCGWARG